MTWHLKDRELEKKLNELSKGEFSKNLHQYDDEHFASFCGEIISLTEDCGYEFDESAGKGVYRQSQFLFFFNNDAIEEVPEYNPHGWNDSRTVTPPENIVFRAKVHRAREDNGETILYECLIFRKSVWYHVINSESCGIQMSLYKNDFVEFKPWED